MDQGSDGATATVDASLEIGTLTSGAVRGTITDNNDVGIKNADVTVYTVDGYYAASEQTDDQGNYTVQGLDASDYIVCADGSRASGGASDGGYLRTCTGDVKWPRNSSGYDLPGDAQIVSVSVGHYTKVDLALDAGAAVTGIVTDADGQPIQGADVTVQQADDQLDGVNAYGSTLSDGTYRVAGLPSMKVIVCVSGALAAGNSSAAGYSDACYKDVDWDRSLPVSGSTSVSLAAGSTRTDIDFALDPVGQITGVVKDSSDASLDQVNIRIYHNGQWESAGESYDGSYTLHGLAPGTYYVCAAPTQYTTERRASPTQFATGQDATEPSGTGYLDTCYGSPSGGVDPAADGPPADAEPVTVIAGTVSDGIDMVMSPAAAVAGTVTDSRSIGLGDVRVEVWDADGNNVGTSWTDDDGEYTIRNLPDDVTYAVCFDASSVDNGNADYGYINECYNDVVRPSYAPPSGAMQLSLIDGDLTSGIDAILADGGAIEVTVTGGDSKTAVTDSYVEIGKPGDSDPLYAWTDDDNTYTVRGVPEGDYVVCAAPDGSSPSEFIGVCSDESLWRDGQSIPSSATATIHVTAGESESATVNMPTGASIAGTVTGQDGPTSTPLANVNVYLFDSDQHRIGPEAATQGDGSYSIDGLFDGDYYVCFDASAIVLPAGSYGGQCAGDSGAVSTSEMWSVPTGASTVHAEAGQAPSIVNIGLPIEGAISGIVTDAQAGAPLEDIHVDAMTDTGERASTETAHDGTYTLTGLSTGEYRVCFNVDPLQAPYLSTCYPDASSARVSVTSGGTTPDIDIGLSLGGKVTGTVTDSAGNPLEIDYFAVFTADGDPVDGYSFYTASGGSFVLYSFAPGAYYVCADAIGATGGSSPTGYQSQCTGDVAWDPSSGFDPVPDGAVAVAVKKGQATTVTMQLDAK